jgi:exodeoxyribonuclease VII large subunit
MRAQRLDAAMRTVSERSSTNAQRWTADRRLEAAFERVVGDRARRAESVGALLESFSYRNVLARGYAVVHGPDGAVVSGVAEARKAQDVGVEFHDGRIAARIAGSEPPRARSRPKKDRDGSQGSLL